ncbi:hypothetical protein SISNIDRAFT_413941 [Sistotremastrum niveocremeum HHB9708]|uniref:Peptidase A2 domain-containing protein n=1 Tax=Sistotremastrum niveocremeum HHB9708 TaxID=1314777 RepID=A0A164SK72_9AGAM|nr:hypothetical protein SISNIDRAFT_413941 [Sistotremastrum niveocremeum HHB9708]
MVDGHLQEWAVLDEGATICVIRKDLWEELHLPIQTAGRTGVEMADATMSQTEGIIRDLPLLIGDLVVFIHAQVVEKAPFRLLLGRPLYQLTLAIREDTPDGGMDITLHDPSNRSHIVKMPTRERGIPRSSGHYADFSTGK